jgi:SAM-dependent methyltransferase
MYDPNQIWHDFWHVEDKQPIVPKNHKNYVSIYGGTNYEPEASIGISCFLEPCRDKFRDGFSILDYGCGAGIVSNFISLRLESFKYVGLEPKSTHGNERITIARQLLSDPRVQFGFIEDSVEKLYDTNFDCITLISIFTHLTIEETYLTLDKLIPFFKNKKTKIIFSCFVDKSYQLFNPQPHINNNFYGVVKITEQQLLDYSSKNGLKLIKMCDFVAAGNHCHNIYSLEVRDE